MVDLALNSDFSVFLNDRNELATVEGRDQFEQSVRVMLTDFLYSSTLGESNFDVIQQKIRLQVSRVARRHDRIDSLRAIDIEKSENDPNTLLVSITYESGDLLEFQVSE